MREGPRVGVPRFNVRLAGRPQSLGDDRADDRLLRTLRRNRRCGRSPRDVEMRVMREDRLRIGIIAVFVVALFPAVYVVAFRDRSGNAGAVTVIGFLIGGLLILTLSERLLKFTLGPISGEFERITKRIDEQQKMIDALRVAVEGVVTKYEYEKLVGLYEAGPFRCWFHENLPSEMKRLYDHGFVKEAKHGSGPKLSNQSRHEEFDLKVYYHIDEPGKRYLQLRRTWLTPVASHD